MLDRLKAMLDREPVRVAAVAVDRDPVAAVSFLRRLGLTTFETFVDPDGRFASGPGAEIAPPFPLYGMPISFGVDASGKRIGYLKGEADWTSREGLALLRQYPYAPR